MTLGSSHHRMLVLQDGARGVVFLFSRLCNRRAVLVSMDGRVSGVEVLEILANL